MREKETGSRGGKLVKKYLDGWSKSKNLERE
jgi:hypothetical protein